MNLGILSNLMMGLIREAKFRPFSGTSCTLGRQTMYMTPEEVLKAFSAEGVNPTSSVQIKIDTQTSSTKGNTILDHSFFALLGFDKTFSVDVSDFEGAEMIVNLNKSIESDQENTCDLLVDGSLLDNVFDPVTALRNAARMVRPNGRIIMMNVGNFIPESGWIPYLMFTGVWFYDYFAINGFIDVQVYTCCYHPQGVTTYMIDHDNMTREFGNGMVPPMKSDAPMAIIVFAEKGRDSTWDRTPTQHAYRPNTEWEQFEAMVERYKGSKRPPFLWSTYHKIADQYTPGWVYVDGGGRIRRPYHEDISDILIDERGEPGKPDSRARWYSRLRWGKHGHEQE